MTLGEKLVYLRKEKNITQSELAVKIYVSRNAISKWETNHGIPNIDNLVLLAKIFDVSIDELINEENLEEIEKANYKRYTIYSFINVLAYFVLNGLIFSLLPDNNNWFSLALIMFLRIFSIVFMVVVDVMFLRKKFLSKKQKRLAKKIDIFFIVIFLLVMVVSVVTIVIFGLQA